MTLICFCYDIFVPKSFTKKVKSAVWPFLCRLSSPKRARNLTLSWVSVHLLSWCFCISFKVGVFLVWHKPPQIWNGSWPSSSGLRGHRRTYLTILKRAWSANYKIEKKLKIKTRKTLTLAAVTLSFFSGPFLLRPQIWPARNFWVRKISK
jgi:hypothetical protein